MGKDWLYWGGGVGGANRSTKRGRSSDARGERQTTPSGCMNAVFHIFDFHQFRFPLNHQPPESFLSEEPIDLKGLEAPRNSLEIEETSFLRPASSSMKEEETLNIPVSMKIKTSVDTKSSRSSISKVRRDEFSSESSSSPGTKTPTLVARLMGLDLLPETSSPRPSSSSSNHSSRPLLQVQVYKLKEQNRSKSNKYGPDNNATGTRSLPETPRISSARRSDVDQRLSLQINKENSTEASEEFEFSKFLSRKIRKEVRQEDETMSPGHHARQIVKQFKESVSRRVGADITNTVKNRVERRDEHVILLKSKKVSMKVLVDEPNTSKQSTPSFSTNLRFLEPKNRTVARSSNLSSVSDTEAKYLTISSKPIIVQASMKDQQNHMDYNQQSSIEKRQKIASEKFVPRPKKYPQSPGTILYKQEESFVRSSTTNRANRDKKSKKTPLSNNLVTTVNIQKTRVPQKQEKKQTQSQVFDALPSKKCTQLSSCLSQSYKPEAPADHDNHQVVRNGNGGATSAELEYISNILKCTGVDEATPISFTKWHSPSHPLNPFIFHDLEVSFPYTTNSDSNLNQRCNRKLIFQLVDELLMDILKPFINFKPWINSWRSTGHEYSQILYGSQLIEKLRERIRSFPLADCRVLEDIDGLVGRDLGEKEIERSAFEEESEEIVAEIERDIVDTLVHESTMEVWQHVRT